LRDPNFSIDLTIEQYNHLIGDVRRHFKPVPALPPVPAPPEPAAVSLQDTTITDWDALKGTKDD